jgi:methionyl-tRNA synthetase
MEQAITRIQKVNQIELCNYYRSEIILNLVCNVIRCISCLFEPYMPSLSAKINFLLGHGDRTLEDETLIQKFI